MLSRRRPDDDIKGLKERVISAKQEVNKVIVGMDEAIESFFIALIAGGHYLVEGMPGLAKTKMMMALARVCGLDYGRINGNSGLTPDDIMGQYLKGSGEGSEKRGGLVFF